MPRLSTSYVKAAGYDQKVRKVLFAQLGKIIPQNEILRKAAEFNKRVFEELRKRGVTKTDVVRIMIDYDLDRVNKEIKWRWDTLNIEVYKRGEEVGDRLAELIEEIDKRDDVLINLLDQLSKNLRKIIDALERVKKLAEEIDSITDSIKKK